MKTKLKRILTSPLTYGILYGLTINILILLLILYENLSYEDQGFLIILLFLLGIPIIPAILIIYYGIEKRKQSAIIVLVLSVALAFWLYNSPTALKLNYYVYKSEREYICENCDTLDLSGLSRQLRPSHKPPDFQDGYKGVYYFCAHIYPFGGEWEPEPPGGGYYAQDPNCGFAYAPGGELTKKPHIEYWYIEGNWWYYEETGYYYTCG